MSRREQTIGLIRGLRAAHHMAFGKRPRRGKMPRPVPPTAIQAEYLKGMQREILQPMRDVVRASIVAKIGTFVTHPTTDTSAWGVQARQDASSEDARKLIERIARQFQEDVGPAQLARLAELIGKRTNEYQRDQLTKQLKRALGVDPLMSAPKDLTKRLQDFTSENVALIKSVPQKFFGDLEKTITSGIRQGKRQEELTGEIEERFDVAESDAARIARDQCGKFFGELNRVRQEDLGIDKFVWRTVGDNRVREEHEEFNGNTYSWSSPPDGGPGQAINCRCWAEPVLDDFI